MGMHATAYLAYGVDVGEEPPGNLTDDQWEEILEEWSSDVINARGYEIVTYCHYEYPMYFLAIPGTEKTAWQGDVTRIDPEELQNTSFNHRQLLDFADAMLKLGVDVDQMGWHMMSEFG